MARVAKGGVPGGRAEVVPRKSPKPRTSTAQQIQELCEQFQDHTAAVNAAIAGIAKDVKEVKADLHEFREEFRSLKDSVVEIKDDVQYLRGDSNHLKR